MDEILAKILQVNAEMIVKQDPTDEELNGALDSLIDLAEEMLMELVAERNELMAKKFGARNILLCEG